MRSRTLAREGALQYLYEIDIVGANEAEDMTEFMERQVDREDAREFAANIVMGVRGQVEEIDTMLKAVSENWTLGRMSVVDRNILRIGVYELAFDEDVPAKVAINEAIDLARRFSSTEATSFVNGVLDNVRKNLPEQIKEKETAE